MRHIFEAPTLTDCGDATAQTRGSQTNHSAEASGKKWALGADSKTPLGVNNTNSDSGTTGM